MSGSVAGFVLGGGASRRFGADKALVRLRDGRTMAEHVAAVLPTPVTLVVARVTPAHRALSLGCIEDRVDGIGPIGGLDAALEYAAEHDLEYAMVAACDMPWLDGELLEAQLAALKANTRATACVLQLDGRWEPMHAVYHVTRCRSVLAGQLAADMRKMQAFVTMLHPLEARAATGIADVERWRASARSANRPEQLGDLLGADTE